MVMVVMVIVMEGSILFMGRKSMDEACMRKSECCDHQCRELYAQC